MEYLFSYGTLQDDAVQKAVFGRKLKGLPDVLSGFELSKNKAYGSYPVVAKTEDASKTIEGRVFEVESGELDLADSYEGAEYQRILVDLASGKKAWIYVGT